MKALVTGGCRSGKSRYALSLAESLGSRRIYLATAEPLDEEMSARIARHKQERDPSWRTIEEPLDIAPLLHQPGGVVLVDCLTLWVSNLLARHDDLAPHFGLLCEALAAAPNPVILVTNEVGLGIVPENALARRFRDEAGFLAQAVASVCDRVVLTVAGLPLTLKDR